jgi:hypothetical protein
MKKFSFIFGLLFLIPFLSHASTYSSYSDVSECNLNAGYVSSYNSGNNTAIDFVFSTSTALSLNSASFVVSTSFNPPTGLGLSVFKWPGSCFPYYVNGGYDSNYSSFYFYYDNNNCPPSFVASTTDYNYQNGVITFNFSSSLNFDADDIIGFSLRVPSSYDSSVNNKSVLFKSNYNDNPGGGSFAVSSISRLNGLVQAFWPEYPNFSYRPFYVNPYLFSANVDYWYSRRLCYSLDYTPSTPTPTTSISLTIPDNVQNYDVLNAIINFYLLDDDINPLHFYDVRVDYAIYDSTDNLVYNDTISYLNALLTVPGSNTRTHSLQANFPPGEYTFKVIMHTLTGDYTDEKTFTISGQFFSSSTTSTISIDQNQFLNPPSCSWVDCPADWLGYGLNKAFVYLFIPNNQQINNLKLRLSSIKDGFTSIFPIRYYFDIFDHFQNTFSAVSSSPPAVSIPLLGQNITLFSADSLNSNFPEFYPLLKQYIGYALYVSVAIMLLGIFI